MTGEAEMARVGAGVVVSLYLKVVYVICRCSISRFDNVGILLDRVW